MPEHTPKRHMTLVVILTVAAFVAGFAGRSQAAVRFVDPQWADVARIPHALESRTTAFSSITEAVRAAEPGDRIVIHSGRYEEPVEKFPIVLDKAITVCSADGCANTVVSGPLTKAVFEVRAAEVEIEGLTIEFKRSGIVVLADRAQIRDNRLLLASPVYRQTSCGVWLAGVRRSQVTGNEFVQCGLAIAGPPISGSSKGLPVLTGLFEVGEDVDFFTTHEISDNLVNRKPMLYIVNGANGSITEDAGQVILVRCSNMTLAGLDVSGASIGIELAYCEGIEVTDVTASRCGLFGVYLCYTNGCVVEGVTCDEDTHGLDLRAVNRNTVRNCTVTRCGQGVFLSWAFDNLVSQCDIQENGVGLFTASGKGNQVAACSISKNEIGVNVKDERLLLLTENVVSENSTTGMRLLNTDSAMCANSLVNNWVGLIAVNSSDVLILDNEFRGNAQCGLYVNNLNRVRISLNQFTGNPKANLEAAGTLTNALITRNTFVDGMKGIVLSNLVDATDLNVD